MQPVEHHRFPFSFLRQANYPFSCIHKTKIWICWSVVVKGNWGSPICHKEPVMSKRCCGVSPRRRVMDWNWRSIKTSKCFSNVLTNTQQNPTKSNNDKTFALYWEFNIFFCFLVHVKTTTTCYTLWSSHVWVNWPMLMSYIQSALVDSTRVLHKYTYIRKQI